MADKRTYIRVDDGIEDHPKVMPLSDKAFRLLITTWGWCSRKRTDGLIKAAVWEKRGTPKVRAELEVELVHRHGHTCPQCRDVPEGYVGMHDYLEHQRSSDEIADVVSKKSAAGRQGNHARWHRDTVDPECEFCPPMGPSSPEPPSDRRSQVRSQVRSQNGRKPSPEDREQRTDTEDSLRSSSAPRKRGTRIDDKFDVTAEMIAWARENTPLVGRAETDRFVDYWRGVAGSRGVKLDWVATWRNWMRKAQDDAQAHHRPAGRKPNADDTIRDLLHPTGSEGATVLQLEAYRD